MMHPKWSCYRMGFQIESRPRPMSIGIKPKSHGWPNRPNYVQQEVQVSETCNIIKRKNQLWIIISFGIFLISYFSLFPLSIFLILAFLFYLGNACVSFIENWLCGLPIFQGKKKILNPHQTCFPQNHEKMHCISHFSSWKSACTKREKNRTMEKHPASPQHFCRKAITNVT